MKTVDDHVGDLIKLLESEQGQIKCDNDDDSFDMHGGIGNDGREENSSRMTSSSAASAAATSLPKTVTKAKLAIDRTVIIYTSDNGFQFGQHRLSIDKVSTIIHENESVPYLGPV